MKNKFIFSFCILYIILTFSCRYGTDNYFYAENQVDNRISDINSLNDFTSFSFNLPEKFRILVLSDTHFGSKTKDVDTSPFFKWIDNLKADNPEKVPAFCLILGDNVDHGDESEYKTYYNFTKQIEKRGIKVLSVVGNHDLFNSGWENYKKYCYPYNSLFKFETKGFSWYGIDTGTGTIGKKQFNLLKEAFEKDKKPKIILSHYPFANTRRQGALSLHDSTERNLLIDLFAKSNVRAALCGHLHYELSVNLFAFKEFGNPSFRYRDKGWTVYEIDESNLDNPTVTELPRDF